MKKQLFFTKGIALIAALFIMGAVTAQTIDAAIDPNIDPTVRSFLKVLNSGTGKPIEQLSATEARLVLVGAQKSVKVDLSGIEVTNKTINTEAILPPTLFPTTANLFPSTLISFPCSATHFVALYASFIATG